MGFQCGNQLRFTGDRVKMIQSALGGGLEATGIKTGNLPAHRAPKQLLGPVVDVIENERNVFDRQRGAQQKDLDDFVESHAVLATFGQEQLIFGGGQGNVPVGIVQNFQLILFAIHNQKGICVWSRSSGAMSAQCRNARRKGSKRVLVW